MSNPNYKLSRRRAAIAPLRGTGQGAAAAGGAAPAASGCAAAAATRGAAAAATRGAAAAVAGGAAATTATTDRQVKHTHGTRQRPKLEDG